MSYILIILGAYLLGCSNMAYYLAKWKKIDLSEHGSGNPGASNATILMGWYAGALVAIHDIGKSVVAIWFAGAMFPDLAFARVIAGVACVLGHIFPFYMKFKGGKGFAPYLGMTLALNWKIALAILVAVVILTIITDYIVVGTITTVLSFPICIGIAEANLHIPLIICIASIVILYRHRENFVRLRNGTEIGLRNTTKGKDRIR